MNRDLSSARRLDLAVRQAPLVSLTAYIYLSIYNSLSLYIYIYIYIERERESYRYVYTYRHIYMYTFTLPPFATYPQQAVPDIRSAHTITRSISEISSCFLGPRPWHIEIRHRVRKTSTINLFGFEALKLKLRRLKLWKPTAHGLDLASPV